MFLFRYSYRNENDVYMMKISFVKNKSPVLVKGNYKNYKIGFLGRWSNWCFVASKNQDIDVILNKFGIVSDLDGDMKLYGYWDFKDKSGYGSSYMPKRIAVKLIKKCLRQFVKEQMLKLNS